MTGFRGVLAAFTVLALATGAAAAGGLEVQPELSTDGVYRLRWHAEGEAVLEESRDAGFADAHTLYRGTDNAAVLTGRTDGTYHYRVREPDGREIGTATVTVAHHSLGRAFGFFAVGAIVFGATTTLIIAGGRREPDHG
jgi:hypothetical protein